MRNPFIMPKCCQNLLIIEPSQALYYKDSPYPNLGADNIIHPAYMEREKFRNVSGQTKQHTSDC